MIMESTFGVIYDRTFIASPSGVVAPRSFVQYWILLADGGAWMDASLADIHCLMHQDFVPTMRVTAP